MTHICMSHDTYMHESCRFFLSQCNLQNVWHTLWQSAGKKLREKNPYRKTKIQFAECMADHMADDKMQKINLMCSLYGRPCRGACCKFHSPRHRSHTGVCVCMYLWFTGVCVCVYVHCLDTWTSHGTRTAKSGCHVIDHTQVCVCVCECVYDDTQVCVYVHAHTCAHVYIYTYETTHRCMCVCVCVCVCVYIYEITHRYVCAYVRIYIYIYIGACGCIMAHVQRTPHLLGLR